MIDFDNVEKYRENNRIEAKKALGGLPHSIWETYSAFANTLGGVILLGVEEYRDKTFHAVNLPDPQKLMGDFKGLLSLYGVVSTNILSDEDVYVKQVNGNDIVVIEVPRATRFDRPVYIGTDAMGGTYKRGGEGDYKCTRDEVEAMIRAASVVTDDMARACGIETASLDQGAVKRYLSLLKRADSRRRIADLPEKSGAIVADADGKVHPTRAALLMLGDTADILGEYPFFKLEYRERDKDVPFSISGDNLLDFYVRVCERFDHLFGDDADTTAALKEALVNCLVNADYTAEGGVTIEVTDDCVRLSNSGEFRVSVDSALRGGVSDPRNVGVLKMFNLIKVTNGLGSGIPFIFETWRRSGRALPHISDGDFGGGITLTLPLERAAVGVTPKNVWIREQRKLSVIEYLTKNICASCKEIARYVGDSSHAVRGILVSLKREGVVVSNKQKGVTVYSLKA